MTEVKIWRIAKEWEKKKKMKLIMWLATKDMQEKIHGALMAVGAEHKQGRPPPGKAERMLSDFLTRRAPWLAGLCGIELALSEARTGHRETVDGLVQGG